MADLQQQKSQIDAEEKRVKDEAEVSAVNERQRVADEEASKIRQQAEEEATRVQNDAQK